MAAGRRDTVPKFIHRISRRESEQLLLTKGIHGSFLVRTCESDPNEYSLSCRDNNGAKHFQFKTTEEGFTAKNLPDEYPTITDLVMVVQDLVDGLALDYAMWPSDPAPEGLLPRMFFGRLSSKHAEKLLLDENASQERNFLIRSSTSRYDQFAFSVRMPENDVVHLLIHQERDKWLFKGKENAREFNSFEELLEFYLKPANKTMVHNDGRDIRLIKPQVCPWNVDYSIVKTNRSSRIPKGNKTTEEFEQLQSWQSGLGPKSEIGRRPENISKNRYKNILPYDETRVILKSGPDYINANYLQIDERFGRYIACQGPLPNTAVDFWRMVWQEESQFIVMLTNTVEGGKNKCNQYWAKDVGGEMMFDQLRIETKEQISQNKDYKITKLLLKDDEQQEQRLVYHCHYIGWPDKTVPKNVKALVEFSIHILRLRQLEAAPISRPIIAHCSAGIGRTGTYILISIIIHHIQLLASTPNIFNFAKQLRQQRPGMVQTAQQYDLVYKAIEIYQKEFSETNAVSYGNVTKTKGPVYGNIGQPLD